MIAVDVSIAAAVESVLHLGTHPDGSSTFHGSYLAVGFVVGSVLASGLYWYYLRRLRAR